jgi:DNA-binding GntR family transcriptional regulator
MESTPRHYALRERALALGWAEEHPIANDTTWLPLRFGALLTGMDLTQETIYHILETC